MNGFGLFLWKDGRSYKGEYKDDKKHNFGIYYGNEGKKYEGFWEDGSQKNLGKYTKKDGSFKIGLWKEHILIKPLTGENEIASKLAEIDHYVEETLSKVENVIEAYKNIFYEFLPDLDLETLLSFD
jgi:hypothetical protein